MTQEVARRLLALARRHDSSAWVEPAGTAVHRARVQASLDVGARSWTSSFAYQPVALSAYLAELDLVRHSASSLGGPLSAVVAAHLNAEERRARAIASADDEVYSQTVAELDGLPGVALVAEARELLERRPRADPQPEEIDATTARERVLTSFERLGLTTWSVEITDAMSAKMSVNGPRQRLRVRQDARFSARQLDRLLVHEVAGHVVRWTNSASQDEPLAVIPIGRTVPTEEGLALLGEHQHALLDETVLALYAARVVAVDLARSAGILEVGRAVAPYVGVETAAQIAMRVKRGLRDPRSPGGSTKDWGYLGGLRMCQQLAADHPEDVRRLLGVKWGLEHLDQVRELTVAGALRTFAPVRLDQL